MAVYIAASIWRTSYISKDVLEKNVVCITYGQPVVAIGYINQVAEKSPQFKSTIHSIFSTEDAIPHMMRPLACAGSLPPVSVKTGKHTALPQVSKLPSTSSTVGSGAKAVESEMVRLPMCMYTYYN